MGGLRIHRADVVTKEAERPAAGGLGRHHRQSARERRGHEAGPGLGRLGRQGAVVTTVRSGSGMSSSLALACNSACYVRAEHGGALRVTCLLSGPWLAPIFHVLRVASRGACGIVACFERDME